MSIRTVRTHTFTPDGQTERPDALVTEEPLEIQLLHGAGANRRRFPLAVTMRTPGDDTDLALGFLFTEGIIGGAHQVSDLRQLNENTLLVELPPDLRLDTERLTRHLFTASSCGVCGKASLDAVQTVACYYPTPNHPRIRPEVLFGLPDTLRRGQAAFEATGGLHAAGLFDAVGRLLWLREDVGRHNAVDKVLGAALQEGRTLPFRDWLLLVSGRAGFELVQKAAMAGLPLLAAVGAPSSLAVELAEDSGMTLVGFLRGERGNVYTGAERVG